MSAISNRGLGKGVIVYIRLTLVYTRENVIMPLVYGKKMKIANTIAERFCSTFRGLAMFFGGATAEPKNMPKAERAPCERSANPLLCAVASPNVNKFRLSQGRRRRAV